MGEENTVVLSVVPVKKGGGKFTEQELKERGVGKNVDVNDYGWGSKKSAYTAEGVWTGYSMLRNSIRVLWTDYTGYVNNELSNKMAQVIMDKFLILRARGEDVKMPEPILPQNALAQADDNLVSLLDFGDAATAEIDPIRDITWIYNNLCVRNIKPCDAPSPGAYAHLRFIQKSEENKMDFLTSVYPKLIPSKSKLDSGSNQNDDNRKHFSLLDQLSAEAANGTE